MLSLMLLTFGIGCGRDLGWSAVLATIRSQHPGVSQLSTDSLAAWLARPPEERPLLLDVRAPAEYRVSHLQDAYRADPGGPLPAQLDTLQHDRPIVTYCSVGYRSSALAERLQEAGFTNVSNLEGSIFAWANEGRPVYRNGQRVRQVHPYNQVWGRLLDPRLRSTDAPSEAPTLPESNGATG